LGNNPEGKYFHAGGRDLDLQRKTDVGSFVDGGVSPFNNPSLQAFMYATPTGYGLQ